MIDPRSISSVIFDFDGTLCSGRYFEPLGTAALAVVGERVFGANATRWAHPWMRGDLSSRDIASYLSGFLPHSEDEIISALRRGCSSMAFNPAVHAFAVEQRAAGRKTALVTANMDVFSEVVAPARELHAVFDVVLNTSDHRTLDKSVLWREALGAFGPECSFAKSVLIDDSPRMVSRFRSLGGHAHQYEDDPTFLSWLAEVGLA